MSKYCVYSGRDCEILPDTEKEIWDNAYYQGRADAIDECIHFVAQETHDGNLCDLLEELKEKENDNTIRGNGCKCNVRETE